MGVRVHKCIGYGLVDIETNKNDEIIDERINSLGYLMSSSEEQEDVWTEEGFIKYLNGHTEKFSLSFYYYNDDIDWQPHNSIIYNSEYGESNILLIIPPGMTTWKRCDDIIDYTEEVAKHECRNRFELLPYGIYPYNRSYTDKRNGRMLKFPFVSEIKRLEKKFNNIIPQDENKNIRSLDSLSQKIGFNNYYEARDNIIVSIPEDIVHLCKYLLLFNDDSYIYDLKPLLYIYWG